MMIICLKMKWAKVLYVNSGLPDNYTDVKFLNELKHNLHFTPVDTWTAIVASTRISTQINITVIFWMVFQQLKYKSLYWEVTYGSLSALILAAYVRSEGLSNSFGELKKLLPILGMGYCCTPILKTLTDTISTDTIYAIYVMLMIIHLASHQYGEDGVYASPYLSLNAAVCAAICLASRLEDTTHAFLLLALAVQTFALFPELYEALNYTLFAFILTTMASLFFTVSISASAAILLFTVLIFVNIVFPLCFIWAQKFKDNLHGPWDEALISPSIQSTS